MSGHLAIVHILLNAGVEIALKENIHNATPLLKAASMGRLKAIGFLLHKGADLRVRNIQGRNALELAQTYQPGGNEEAVRFIEKWIAKLGDEPKKQTAREIPGIERPRDGDFGDGKTGDGGFGHRSSGARSSRDKSSRD